MTITREEWDELRADVTACRDALAHLLEVIVLAQGPEGEEQPEEPAGLNTFPGFEHYRAGGEKGNA